MESNSPTARNSDQGVDAGAPRVKAPGRKKSTKPHLTAEESRAALRALDEYRTRNFISYPDIEEQFSSFGRNSDIRKHHKYIEGACDFECSASTLNNAINDQIRLNSQNTNAIYLWMFIENHDKLTEYIYEENLKNKDRSVSSIKEILAHGADLNYAKIKAYQGFYAVYRPSHLNPNTEISLCKLIIGPKALGADNGSDFDCKFEHQWLNDGRIERTEARGKVVPHGDRMMAILATAGRGSFTIMFDGVNPTTDHKYQMHSMSGIMIAAATSEMSAWPLYAIRREDGDFEFKTIPVTEWERIPSDARDSLSRGNIYWENTMFPGFGLGYVRDNPEHGLPTAKRPVSRFLLAAANPLEPQP